MRLTVIALHALCVLWLRTSEVHAVTPAAGYYYSSNGGSTGTCNITACAYSSCQPGQYLSGCTFNSSGLCSPCTNTPAAGYYWSNYGQGNGVCPTLQCTICPAGQKNTGCGDTNPGTCGSCGTPPSYKYWMPNADATSKCPLGDQLTCLAGQFNLGANNTAAGVCTACSSVMTLPQYKYWTTPSNPGYTCAYLDQTKCSDGYVNSIVASAINRDITAGNCSACPLLGNTGTYYGANVNAGSNCPTLSCEDRVQSCAIGQFISGCGDVSPFTSPGTCANCTNAPNSSMVYTGRGSWTGNCPVDKCPTTGCSLGQYMSGCGGLPSSLQCKPCSNAVAGVSFYVGIGITSTCATQNCVTCRNGYYTKDCTVLADGTCERAVDGHVDVRAVRNPRDVFEEDEAPMLPEADLKGRDWDEREVALPPRLARRAVAESPANDERGVRDRRLGADRSRQRPWEVDFAAAVDFNVAGFRDTHLGDDVDGSHVGWGLAEH